MARPTLTSQLKMDGITSALPAAEPPTPDATPLLPEGTEGIVVVGGEIKRPPIVVRTSSGGGYWVSVFAAEISIVELRLLLDRAIAARKSRVQVIVLGNPKEILTPGSEVGV